MIKISSGEFSRSSVGGDKYLFAKKNTLTWKSKNSQNLLNSKNDCITKFILIFTL